MGRRNDHSRDELRELCVNAAGEIIQSEGLGGLTARKVASAIGYSPGTLYVAFQNLDEIILHVNGETLADLYECIRLIPDLKPDPLEAALALANTYLQYAVEHPYRWRSLFEHRLPPSMPLPDWFNALTTRMFAVVAEPLERIRPAMTPEESLVASRALWSSVHGVASLGLDSKLEIDDRANVHHVMQLLVVSYVRGLAAGEEIAT